MPSVHVTENQIHVGEESVIEVSRTVNADVARDRSTASVEMLQQRNEIASRVR